MDQTIFDFVIGATAVAGFSVIWRNWVEDHPRWESTIRKVLRGAHKALTCGPCFTYWVAFAFTIVVRPLSIWMPVGESPFGVFSNFILQWMALAWLSVFLRFAYVALQQYVRKNGDA